MPTRHIPISRRMFLRGTGAAIALPLLDVMRPSFGGDWIAEHPHRMLCICTNMGMIPDFFFPQNVGRDYVPSEYMKILDPHRDELTVFSGLSHPDVDGGHHAEISFLTAAPHPAGGGFQNSISLDQFAAERIGIATRFPYLALSVGSEGARGLSWTSAGVMIPADGKPSEVFQKLFVQGSSADIQNQVQKLRDGRSVLDTVADRAKQLQRKLGPSDKRKVEEYFTSVRELEQRLVTAEEWEHHPKPIVDVEPPTDIDNKEELIARTRLMNEMSALAFETDSTRIITLMIDQNANPKVNLPGVTQGHHSLTHHGQRPETVEELKTIESAQTRVFGDLLNRLKSTSDAGHSLLDKTMVLYGSNLGNANSHDNRNLPIVLAGGGFQHGSHIAFDRTRNHPLPNLFVSMLQRLGIEADKFASSTGTLRGLEMKA